MSATLYGKRPRFRRKGREGDLYIEEEGRKEGRREEGMGVQCILKSLNLVLFWKGIRLLQFFQGWLHLVARRW